MKKTILILLACLIAGQYSALAQCQTCPNLCPNQVLNGDFEQGMINFTSDYTFSGGICPAGPNTYSIATDASVCSPYWSGTGNPGKFLMADGSLSQNKDVVKQTMTGLTLGATYIICVDANNLMAPPNNWGADPNIAICIDGIPIINRVLPVNPDSWVTLSTSWVATSTSVVLSVRDLDTTFNSNDFALDNLSFRRCVKNPGMRITNTTCNYYCMEITDVSSSTVLSNIKWYIDGVLEPTSSRSFCKFLPKGARTIKLTYNMSDGCINRNDTFIRSVVVPDCPCDFGNNLTIAKSFQACNKYSFSLSCKFGYQLGFNQWTVDGIAVTGLSMSTLELDNLSPGTHVICANAIGSIIEQSDNHCCSKKCVTIVVPEYSTNPDAIVIDTIVNYCTLVYPQGPYVKPGNLCGADFYVYTRDNMEQGTSVNGPVTYTLNSTSLVRCYETLPGGVKCLKKTYRFTTRALPVSDIAMPDVTLCATDTAYYTVCAGAYAAYQLLGSSGTVLKDDWTTSAGTRLALTPGEYTVVCYDYINCGYVRTRIHVKTPVGAQMPDVTLCAADTANYTFNCGSSYTRYELQKPDGTVIAGGSPVFGGVNVTLTAGEYVLICYDYNACTSLRTNIHASAPIESSCTVNIEVCDRELNEAVFTQWMTACPDCKQTILNATKRGPWKQVSYDSSFSTGFHKVTREYIDEVTCRRCIMQFNIGYFTTEVKTFYTSQLPNETKCINIYDADLDPCLRKRRLKKYQAGHPELSIDVDGQTGIQLCCENRSIVDNVLYYLIAEDDPCCFMRVNLTCGESVPVSKMAGNTGNTQEADNALSTTLHIVPNPTSSVFRITSDRDYERYEKVDIVDVNGKVVLTMKDIDSRTPIDMSRFSAGVYTVRINASSGEVTILKLIRLDNW